jgi:hypothetical protein
MAAIPELSGIIARQIGSIQGKLSAQVQSRVLAMLSKFTNQCPTGKELQKIIKERNNLIKAINSFEKRVQKLGATANKLNGVITTARVAIQVIKNIPLPTAIIPPMSGGLGIPVSILTRYSDALIRLNKLLDALEADRQGILGVVSTVSGTLLSLKARLQSLDIPIQECSKQSPDLATIVTEVQPLGNTGSEGTPSEDYLYKGYTLAIVLDPNSPRIAPKRYAIASDRQGVLRLRGDSSFSSSTQVLLDEIKFRIDNQFT